MGANNMFVDSVVIAVSVCEAVAAVLLGQWGQVAVWVILAVYAVFNLLDRQLAGSQYDY